MKKYKMLSIVMMLLILLSGCGEKAENTSELCSESEETWEEIYVESEVMADDVAETSVEEQDIDTEASWQMTEEEKSSFGMILMGISTDVIYEKSMEKKAQPFSDEEKYAFMISFLPRNEEFESILPYRSTEYGEIIVSEQDVNMILQSALGSGGIEGDFQSVMHVGYGYVMPVENEMYKISQGDVGDTQADIEILEGKQIDDDRFQVAAELQVAVLSEFHKYHIDAIFKRNEDSIFCGYTFDSSEVTETTTWQEAYAAALSFGYMYPPTTSRELDLNSSNRMFWGLHDFDGDGIPELLIPVLPNGSENVEAEEAGESCLDGLYIFAFADHEIQEVYFQYFTGAMGLVYFDAASGHLLAENGMVYGIVPASEYEYNSGEFRLIRTASTEVEGNGYTEINWYYPEQKTEILESWDAFPVDILSNNYQAFTYHDFTDIEIRDELNMNWDSEIWNNYYEILRYRKEEDL